MAANGLNDEDEAAEPPASCPKCERVEAQAAEMVIAATEVSDDEILRLRVELATVIAALSALCPKPFGLTEEQDLALKAFVAEQQAEAAKDCLQVGKVYRHPESNRLLRVIGGTFIGGYGRISNFWDWQYLDEDFSPAGEKSGGYGWAAKPLEEPCKT